MSTKKLSSGSKSSKRSSSSSSSSKSRSGSRSGSGSGSGSGSSSRHVSNMSEKSNGDTMPQETINTVSNSVIIVAIIWQSLILLYLYKLEESDCKCIIDWKNDWRHSYIKNFTIVLICINILKLLMTKLRNSKLLSSVLIVLDLINLYAFFTYINDLNKNNCNCATEKQYFLNMLLQVFVWFRVIAIICVIILFIIGFFYMSSLGSSKSATK